MMTLGAFALGVFVSCSSKAPQDELPQDRSVRAFDVVPTHLDPTWLSSHPDSSGWRLRWELPSSSDVIESLYVFRDTITTAQKDKLINGTDRLDESSLPKIAARLGGKDTSWSIPSSFFQGAQGKKLRTDTSYTFSVWARYRSGPTGLAPSCILFVGDKIPPVLTHIDDSAGQTQVVLRFQRPRDQASLYDTGQTGVLRSVGALWWEGASPNDSAGKVHWTAVPASILRDASQDTFRLVLSPMKVWTRYCYVVVAEDTSGNVGGRTSVFQAWTHDASFPAAASNLSDTLVRSDSVAFSWSPATDTSDAGGKALRDAHPNYHIRRYVVRLDGKGVDSVDLSPTDAANLEPGQTWSQSTLPGRFSWNGSEWNWYWRDFRPGKSWRAEVVAYDWSGNASLQNPSITDSVPLPPALAGRCGPGWAPVAGDSSRGLSDYCIEEHEHAVDGKVVTRVTWKEAKQACADIQSQLCSEAQWVRACMSFPGDGRSNPYGAVGVGEGGTGDTLAWLQGHCQLGTGDSLALRDLSNTDPRCVSGWGVYDMPGRVGEWTRDVYNSNPSGPSNFEAGTLAYLGPSDLPNQPDIGTIHGGSALVLDQIDRTLTSARCLTRNYPASSVTDTLRDGSGNLIGVIQHPLPTGISSAWGFRCCKRLP